MRGELVWIVIISSLIVFGGCTQQQTTAKSDFEKMCESTGGMWMTMKPMKNSQYIDGDECAGCMSADGTNHYCDMEKYSASLK